MITTWFADLVQSGVPALVEAAERIPPGSDSLVLLPYFAGERTPLFDPQARGCWMGLTLRHTRAHLYRSILEGVAYGARHNLETMAEAGGRPRRLFAVGGGTRGSLWTQIISDVTRLRQCVPTITVGASYGDAQMAADAAGVETGSWNPVAHVIEPDGSTGALYDRLYGIYRRAYPALRDDLHTLGAP